MEECKPCMSKKYIVSWRSVPRFAPISSQPRMIIMKSNDLSKTARKCSDWVLSRYVIIVQTSKVPIRCLALITNAKAWPELCLRPRDRQLMTSGTCDQFTRGPQRQFAHRYPRYTCITDLGLCHHRRPFPFILPLTILLGCSILVCCYNE